MAGTYRIRAGILFSNIGPTTWKDHTGGTSNLKEDSWPSSMGGSGFADYANFFNLPTQAPGNYILSFDGDDSAIYVDGVPTGVGFLPVGFHPTTARVKADFNSNILFTPFTTVLANGISIYLRFSAGFESSAFLLTSNNQGFIFNFPSTVPDINTLLTLGLGVRLEVGSSTWGNVRALEIEGAYDLQAFTWTIDNSHPYKAGDPITINSPDTNPDLTTVDEVVLSYEDTEGVKTIIVPPSNFTSVTPTQLIVPIPETLCDYVGNMTVAGKILSDVINITSIVIQL